MHLLFKIVWNIFSEKIQLFNSNQTFDQNPSSERLN